MQYQKNEIRERIISAGRQEFLASGYRAGKISVVAQNAGVPIGNLYRYVQGKDGLFEAVVGAAYTLIPKRIADIFSECVLTGFAEVFSKEVIKLFDEFGTEIIILTDKSEGSAYQDFAPKIYALADKHFNGFFVKTGGKEDMVFCSVLGKAFCDMIFDILRKGDRESYGDLINRAVRYCFFEIENRI